jgi:ATP-dependent DNA helicase RecQ
LRYFDEAFDGPCGACDNCRNPRELEDFTLQAKQLLSCVARLAQRGERFGAAHIVDILRGSRSERVLSRNHDSLSVYGIGKERSVEQWRTLIRALLHQGLMAETQDGYPVLCLNASSWQVLRDEQPVHIAQSAKAAPTQRETARAAAGTRSETGGALFETLRALRKQLADAQGLPPYGIFHDATLREMADRKPRSLSEFAGIRGVGEAKLARYGERFVAAVREHIESPSHPS